MDSVKGERIPTSPLREKASQLAEACNNTHNLTQEEKELQMPVWNAIQNSVVFVLPTILRLMALYPLC